MFSYNRTEEGGIHVKHIVWDWNGTLLDDVQLCFECINRLLISQHLPVLPDLQAYRSVFQFPVENYYRSVGFDFDQVPFETLAHQYMEDYQSKSRECSLFDDVESALDLTQSRGACQHILSASKKENLLSQMNWFPIWEPIDSVWGIEDIYARSKVELASQFMSSKAEDEEVWFIGDSLHDAQVASSVGANCALVARGHQSHSRLSESKMPVYETLLHALEDIL